MQTDLLQAGRLRTRQLQAGRLRTRQLQAGRLRSLEFIDHVLNTTRIEYISLSRPLVREPALIRRWQQGDTRPSLCVSCNSCYRTAGHQCVFLCG